METISLALSVLDITKGYSGFACVSEKEECECLEGFTYCKSATHVYLKHFYKMENVLPMQKASLQ